MRMMRFAYLELYCNFCLLDSEWCDKVRELENEHYNRLGIDGIKGQAAEWRDMTGGAGQIVIPFGGDVLEKIGILKEN